VSKTLDLLLIPFITALSGTLGIRVEKPACCAGSGNGGIFALEVRVVELV
jgi:hypothetical protein